MKQVFKSANIDQELFDAIDNADHATAVRLIAQGANVNGRHPGSGLPLIHYIVAVGCTEVTDAVLATGRCDLTVRDHMDRLPSDVADLVARDYELAERLAEEQAKQFHARGMDPRRPSSPDYGDWKWEP